MPLYIVHFCNKGFKSAYHPHTHYANVGYESNSINCYILR